MENKTVEFGTWLLHLLMCIPMIAFAETISPTPRKINLPPPLPSPNTFSSYASALIASFFILRPLQALNILFRLFTHTQSKRQWRKQKSWEKKDVGSHFFIDFTNLPDFLQNIFAIFNQKRLHMTWSLNECKTKRCSATKKKSMQNMVSVQWQIESGAGKMFQLVPIFNCMYLKVIKRTPLEYISICKRRWHNLLLLLIKQHHI